MPPPAPSPADVAARRRAADLSICAVVPARDEAATVATVVSALRTLVAADVLAEVVVVDGASGDDTAALAAAAGARVVQQGTDLGALPPGRGKGDAMWQGVRATDADVVVFVDADIRAFDAGFVLPLLLPLLDDPSVQFTKAAYDRPLGTTGAATGGGRVTELLARPLLTMFWPELTFLAQPLSGEYAARTSLLRTLPFVQGYGVELGLLIDTVERHGADAIAEVDLGVRHHGHQPLDALGRMAAELLAVGLDRAQRYGRSPTAEPVLRQPLRDDGVLRLVPHDVRIAERPPLAG